MKSEFQLFPSVFALEASAAPLFTLRRPAGFLFPMAVEISSAVWAGSQRFKNGTLLVLLRLADWANIEGVCWPSVATVAKFCRMTGRQAQRIMRELEIDGVLVVQNRGQTHQANIYKIVVENLADPKGDILDKGDILCPPRVTFPAENVLKMSPHPLGSVIEPSLGLEEAPDLVSAETIYLAYPRRVAKGAAVKAIAKAMRDVPAIKLLAVVKVYAEATATWPEEDRKFIPYPASWFNAARYHDDPNNWKRNGTSNGKINSRGFSNSNVSAYADLDAKMASKY